jgi:hypothetical protein
MKAAKLYFIITAVFVLTFLLATYFEFGFRVMVIRLCIISTNHKILFTGKNFLFFPTLYFELFFSIFSTIIVFRLLKANNPRWLFKIFMIAVLFVATLILSCFIYAEANIMECTACNDHQKLRIFYHEVPYNTLFLISLLIPLLVFIISDTTFRNPSQ